MELQEEKILVEEVLEAKNVIYLIFFYMMENFVAEKILRLINGDNISAKNNFEAKNLDSEIKKFSLKKNICLTKMQEIAVKDINQNQNSAWIPDSTLAE